MKKSWIIHLQRHLRDLGYYPGAIDGIAGQKTFQGARRYSGKLKWPRIRTIVAALQKLAHTKGIDAGPVDGLVGPQTRYAVAALIGEVKPGNRPDKIKSRVSDIIKPKSGFPRASQLAVRRFYGGIAKNQVKIQLPYPHKLAWQTDKVIRSHSVHKKVKDSLERILERTREHYGMGGIRDLGLDLWGGCLNPRKMRGGRSWSMHSWGIACDYHPAMNRFRWPMSKALFGKQDYAPWMTFWREEGWSNLGEHANMDAMHFEATNRGANPRYANIWRKK